MKISTVLFDLDGTLLPMDQDVFVKKYFGLLCNKLAPRGYEPQKLIDTIWGGTAAMVKNDGTKTNEEVFLEYFVSVYGDEAKNDLPLFDEFYRNEFSGARDVCGSGTKAAECVAKLKKMRFRAALATNPIFPAVATENRVSWAGLSTDDFELYTTYENSHYCKPNPLYYKEVADSLGVKPDECLMIGNDAVEDLAAEKIGMKVFLLTDCLINKKNIDISAYPHGGFDELMIYIEGLE